MRDLLRQRVLEAAEVAQTISRTRIYDTIRVNWHPSRPSAAPAKNALSDAHALQLFSRPPADLSMEELISLADHVELCGFSESELQAIESSNWEAEFLPRLTPEASREEAKAAAMRYSLWLGFIAGPALAQLQRFDAAIALLHQFTLRLSRNEFRHIEGAGGDGNSGMRLLITAPAIAGLAQYCPEELDFAAFNRLRSYITLTRSIADVSECVTLRVACLGIVARHPAASGILQRARSIADGRFERKLASAFDVFSNHPEQLNAQRQCNAA